MTVKITDLFINHSGCNQAELWVRFLKMRTDGMSQVLQTKEDVDKVLRQLLSDYPHTEFVITEKGENLGVRRVFLDKSYVDAFYADAAAGNFCWHVGTMTEGQLGTAANGEVLTH